MAEFAMRGYNVCRDLVYVLFAASLYMYDPSLVMFFVF